MATRYASSEASNGFPIGNDTTGTGSAAAPYLTLSKLLSVSTADGDVAIANGSHRADAALAQGFGFFNIPRSITVQASVPGVFTLTSAAGVARTINVTATTGSSVVIDGFIVDSENGTKYTIDVALTNAATLTVQNCDLRNPGRDIIFRDPNTSTKLVVKNTKISGTATTGGIVVTAAGATKRVEIDGVSGSVTGITASNGGAIVLTATISGATARVENCNGLTATTNNSGSSSGVININGMYALVQNNRNMAINEVAANSSSGLIMIKPVAGVQADSGVLIRNSGFNNCTGGYLSRVGTDGASANDNLLNSWVSVFNDYTANPAASTLHGVMFGSVVGGLSLYDTVRNAGISFLSKLQTTGALFINGVAEQPVGGNSVFYSKGSVGAKCLGISVRLRRGVSTYTYRIEDDPTIPTHSTGAVCSGGNIWSDDPAGTSQLVLVGTSNTATFSDNNYTVVSVTGTPWSYQGTAYATLALWSAANELTSRAQIPIVTNAAFHHNAYIPYAIGQLGVVDPWLPSTLGLIS